MENKYHIALELTSQSIKLVAGFVLNEKVYVVDVIQRYCAGLSNGLIQDVDETVKVLKEVIANASQKLNCTIKDVSLVLPPFNLACATDSGSTNTIDGNDRIQHVDVSNIITQIKKRNFKEKDLKIIDVIPDRFYLDNNEQYLVEPLGKISETLSLHASIYAISNKVVALFENCFEKAGINIKYMTISPYASSLYLSTIDGMPSSYILFDLGHSFSTITYVHQKNTIIKSSIVAFGGDDITKYISKTFNISYKEAEILKIKYGIDSDPCFEVPIKEGITFNRLADAITSSIKPFLSGAKRAIDELNPDKEDLPIVLIGGTSSLKSIENLIADELEQSVLTYQMLTIGARDRGLIPALGLIKYCANQPHNDEEEKIDITISRVDNRKSGKVDLSEEL